MTLLGLDLGKLSPEAEMQQAQYHSAIGGNHGLQHFAALQGLTVKNTACARLETEIAAP